jgi:hypothetical protein
MSLDLMYKEGGLEFPQVVEIRELRNIGGTRLRSFASLRLYSSAVGSITQQVHDSMSVLSDGCDLSEGLSDKQTGSM